jgi:hypothetical protein
LAMAPGSIQTTPRQASARPALTPQSPTPPSASSGELAHTAFQLKLPLPRQSLSSIRGRGDTPAAASNASPSDNSGPETVGEKPQLESAQEVSLRSQRVLLKGRQLTTELGVFYAKSERQDLRLLVSPDPMSSAVLPLLADLEQDSLVSVYTLRVGLLNDLQLFANAPLIHQTNTVTLGGTAGIGGLKNRRTRTRWGDATVGLRYALIKEGPGYPEIIPSLLGQIDTGDGASGVGGGLAFIKSLDPAVLFVNFNYRHLFRDSPFVNLARRLPEAEDTFDASVGYAFALNDSLTLNAAVLGTFTRRAQFQTALAPTGRRITLLLPSRERLSLQIGLTSLITKKFYIEPNVNFSLTGTGSDTSVGLNLPYTFEF